VRDHRDRLVRGCFRRLKLGLIKKHAEEYYERTVVVRIMKVMIDKYRESQEDRNQNMQA
jgi:hypothetical protein